MAFGSSMSIKASHIWFGVAFAAFVGTAFAFMNFWAALELGYDASSRGKEILNGWCYACIGLSLSTVTLLVLGVRSWLARRDASRARS